MKKLILFLVLLLSSFSLFSQKNYLQTKLTNSVISNFFDSSKDYISFKNGEFDNNRKCYVNAIIDTYSSRLNANVKIESDSQGYIDGIVISHTITSIDEYNNLVNSYLVINAGVSQTNKTKNINKKYNLISTSRRNDTFLINGNIEGRINSYGQYTGNGHLTVYFTSVYMR